MPTTSSGDAADLGLGGFFRERRELLVDQAIQLAKDYGYAQYTTTIRAAWTEAIDTVTDCLSGYLHEQAAGFEKPEGDTDYLRDPRFARMRDVAKRHRAIGVTLQLYLGLFKHFRDLYLAALAELPASRDELSEWRGRVRSFFDVAELSIGADWAEATEDDRLVELQARSRAVTLDKDRYFAVFESLRDPAFLLDRDRRLLTANQAAAELFVGEAGAGDIVYLRAMRGRRTSLQAALEIASRAGEEGGPQDERPIWLDTRRGAMCFDLRERAIHDALENTRLGYVVILHDVTTHRRATEEAVRARRAMSVFLATMSHEIRTPLHGVLGATELLREADGTGHDTYVDAIETAGRYLLQTLNKVLDFSRIEARPPDPTPRACRLQAVLEDYGQFVSVWARRANVPFTLSLAGNLPRQVMIDWDMTQQVLTNLVSNALRHASGGAGGGGVGGGGVTLRVRRRRGTESGPALRFEVLDQGPGISSSDAEILFEPFGTRTPGTSRGDDGRIGGSGLGLAICRRLVEAMGGTIGFRNRRSGGAVFWFDLTYGRVVDRMADAPCEETGPWVATDGLRCLLVDDDSISRMVTADQLSRCGLTVAQAASAEDAVEAMRTSRFDVVLVDYYLPDADGASLVRQLRQIQQTRAGHEARYVALTANADLVATLGDEGHPFDALLAKPAAGEALLAAVLGSSRQLDIEAHAARPPQPVPALNGVSPRIVEAMAKTFTDRWAGEAAKVRHALQVGDRDSLADLAHRAASSCAVMGLTDLADQLRALETACRRKDAALDAPEWLSRLDGQLSAAPDRARALAAAAE